MTPEQLVVFKAALLAETDPELVGYRDTGDNNNIAKWYNVQASPAFTVWKRVYTPEEIAKAIEVGITQLDGLTASKREVLLWWSERSHDPATSQAAIADMCGSQNTLKAAVIAGGKRLATRAEKLLASGVGSDASPATLGWEGQVTRDLVLQAKES